MESEPIVPEHTRRTTYLFILLGIVIAAGLVMLALYVYFGSYVSPEMQCESSGGAWNESVCIFERPDTRSPETAASYKDVLSLIEPKQNATVTSPLVVRGMARGSWFFEASFPLILTDWDGRIIAEGHAQADGEWMTPEYVPFTGRLTFTVPEDTPYRRGTLILKKDNPSGLPEHDDAFEIPVTF